MANMTFKASLLPSIVDNNTIYSLGSSTAPWNSIYANGLSAQNLTLTGALSVTGNAYLSSETMASSISADSLLVTGSAGFVNSPTAPTPAANDNSTKLATTAFVQNAFTTNDAMVFKGLVNSDSDLHDTHKQGWTYKVATAGMYAGQYCEIGDTIYCVADGTAASNADWVVLEVNNEDNIVGPATTTDNAVARFDGTTGKVIQNSGVTINDAGVLNTAGLMNSDNNTILSPKGGFYLTGSVTGAIKITLPRTWDNTYLCFFVDIYNYNNASSTTGTYCITGYSYLGGGYWLGKLAWCVGGYDLTVRWGHDGEKCCIYIGETSSTWVGCSIRVRDVSVRSNSGIGAWASGWSISIASSFLGVGAHDYVSNPNIKHFSKSYTPAGSISSTSITPAGTNSSSAVTITPATTDVYSMTSAGSVTAGSAATLTMSAEDEVLSFNWTANTPTAVTLPGRSSAIQAWTGYTAATAAAQTFTGTAASHSHTFTGTAATISN